MKLSKLTDGLVGQPMFNILAQANALERAGQKLIHLEIGDNFLQPDKKIINSCISSLEKGDIHYTSSYGYEEFRKEIALATLNEYGFKPQLDQIVVMPANAVIDTMVRCVCEQGDTVTVETPCFPTYTSVIQYLNLEHSEVVNDKTKLLIINSPCNPTGKVKTVAELRKILAESKGKYFVLLDDTYSQLDYTCVAREDLRVWEYDNVLILKSLSKSHAIPGFRLGYAIGNRELISKMALMFQTVYSCMPIFTQKAGIQALRTNTDIMYRDLRYLRDYTVYRLNRLDCFTCEIPDGGIYAFPKIIDPDLNEQEVVDILLRNGVVVIGGSCFGKNGQGNIRICFARDRRLLDCAFDIMEGCLC